MLDPSVLKYTRLQLVQIASRDAEKLNEILAKELCRLGDCTVPVIYMANGTKSFGNVNFEPTLFKSQAWDMMVKFNINPNGHGALSSTDLQVLVVMDSILIAQEMESYDETR